MTTTSTDQFNPARVRAHLKAATLGKLFINELGWDNSTVKHTVPVGDVSYTLTAAAEKRGFQALICTGAPGAGGNGIPPYAVRKQIEKGIAKKFFEHVIIYVSADKTEQVWQWVRREPGKPDASRETPYHNRQSGDGLIARLRTIAFTLDEEESLTLPKVAGSIKQGFDIERVTKRFYDQFKKEHDDFLKFLKGIPDADLQAWYASVMLNRLMFIYFMQSKGFLADDRRYLRHKLEKSQERAKDAFYRDFLCPLFFEGFAQEEQDRSAATRALLGAVPYLNGGLFARHQIEQAHGKTIIVPDAAFEQIFTFFDGWDWVLDDRPTRKGNEINPDVLGYIFEKYINQKQMGAYYTKEDITEYICRNTIVPHLLDRAEEDNLLAFDAGPDVNAILGRAHPHPEHTVWRHLREDPDRYIYAAVKHGVELKLPAGIAAGVANVGARGEWNKPADAQFALPTEIWRETVARRQRYTEVRAQLASGAVTQSNDLITLNLNLRQFARDVIDQCDDPALLRSLWAALTQVSVLDPTCGSGAFLFAALNVLDDLYDAALDRMEYLAAKQPESAAFADFRSTLDQVKKHPNRRYFILKSIIVNNLYGVDIMEEAVEIAKLRLFLKLVAQLETGDKIEPLPDIDFNIRAGNTLVGFVSREDVGKALQQDAGGQGKLVFGEEQSALAQIERDAQEIERAFANFRALQTQVDGSSRLLAAAKAQLQSQLDTLDDQLDRLLARQYGIDPSRPKQQAAFDEWRKSHEPFHWFIEYYGVMSRGGFDVIVGNPPYVEYSVISREYSVTGFRTQPSGNLYAYVLEQSLKCARKSGRVGMIVQLSALCTDRMSTLQAELHKQSSALWTLSFDDRPAKLFDGLEHIRAAILVMEKADIAGEPSGVHSTGLTRWYTEFREMLFELPNFQPTSSLCWPGSIPKIGDSSLRALVQKVAKESQSVGHAFARESAVGVFYYRSPLYWIRSMDFLPFFSSATAQRSVHHLKDYQLRKREFVPIVGAIINSTLFYVWFVVYGNGRNVALRDIHSFPCNVDSLARLHGGDLSPLFSDLMDDYRKHSIVHHRKDGVGVQEFYPSNSKPIIDKIDRVLAKHYGFTDEELDYIINYDIKYRMGDALNDDEEA